MNDQAQPPLTRGQIVERLVITLLFLPLIGILNAIIMLAILFQYIFLLVTLKHCEPVRVFTNKVIAYGYRVWRYTSLNENRRPFPCTELPGEIEPSEREVSFK